MKKFTLSIIILSILLFGCTTDEEQASVDIDKQEDKTITKTFDIPPVVEACINPTIVNERKFYIKDNHYFLTFPRGLTQSTMRYCTDMIDTHGSAFELDFIDAGGSGMDGYPNGGIGGIKSGGTWYPGDKTLTGMPVQLSELDDSMILQWKVSQENALDDDDKWMASINMIFTEGKEDSVPQGEDRDFDLVIESNSHRFDNSLDDTIKGKKSNYLARHPDGSLRTFDIVVEEKTYRYGVRYKFYTDSGDKDNKVHVKYIPINEENVPPYLNHSVKSFIDNAKEFIQYANMSDDKRTLSYAKVASSHLYLKSIQAGYEVYQGQSTLRNDFYRIVLSK